MIFSLTAMMSKMIALGMSVNKVIQCVTSNAAQQINESEELGTLRIGTLADISVLKLVHKHVTFYDKFSNKLDGHYILSPVMTIIGGNILYRSVETI